MLGLGFSSINGKNDDTGAKLGSLSPDQLSFNIGVKIPELQSVIGWRGIAATEFENVDDEDSDEEDEKTPEDAKEDYAAKMAKKGATLPKGFIKDAKANTGH